MPRLGKMYPDLMGAAGVDTHGQQGKTAARIPVQALPLAMRRFPSTVFRHHSHTGLQRGVTPQRQAAFATRRRQAARYGQIGLGNLARGKSPAQLQAGLFAQSDNHQPGSIHVQTVHNARTQPIHPGQLRHTGDQAMHQRSFRAAGAGVHGQMRRFVQHCHMLILVQDIQLAILRLQPDIPPRNHKYQFHTRNQAKIRLNARLAVHQAMPFPHGSFDF